MSEHIKIEKNAGIMTIVIDRPEKKNALTLAMYDALADALQDADSDKSVRVLLLTAVGDVFTAGNDILDFIQNPPQSSDSPVMRFLTAIRSMEKPLVIAVNGLAIGIGTTMLLHADLVYASDQAIFRLPFVDLALVPEAGSSYLLPRMIGHQRAAELMLLAEPFDANKAKDIGIVLEILPPGDLLDHANERAAKLAEKPPAALRQTKKLLKNESNRIVEAMDREGALFFERLSSEEAREALMAFMEKREPDFSRFD